MEKLVYKDAHLKPEKIGHLLAGAAPGSRVLIVFWHGLGDTLMFLPLFDHVVEQFPNLNFTLGLLPGVDQEVFLRPQWPTCAVPESEFLANHDAAFVVSFPMVEGASNMTKAEYCCQEEFGMASHYFGLPDLLEQPVNKLVGVHFQGTCLPGSTNPDAELAHRIWSDIREAGYVPIDLHFCHVFHNPENRVFEWATRSCRDLRPSLATLRMMMGRCCAVVAVASGPFVLAASIMPSKTIYLQKHHTVECYLRDFKNVIDLQKYGVEGQVGELEKTRLISMLWAIEEQVEA